MTADFKSHRTGRRITIGTFTRRKPFLFVNGAVLYVLTPFLEFPCQFNFLRKLTGPGNIVGRIRHLPDRKTNTLSGCADGLLQFRIAPLQSHSVETPNQLAKSLGHLQGSFSYRNIARPRTCKSQRSRDSLPGQSSEISHHARGLPG